MSAFNPNRAEQAREILVRLRGVVPDDVLRNIIQALIASDEQAQGGIEGAIQVDSLNTVFLCGLDPTEGGLAFQPLRKAINDAQSNAAMETAKTWGEYLALDATGAGEYYRDCLKEGAKYSDLEDFRIDHDFEPDSEYKRLWGEFVRLEDDPDCHEEDLQVLEEKCKSVALREFKELRWSWDRPPMAEDEFSKSELERVCFDRGIRMDDPSLDMHGTVPKSIEEEFATLQDGVWDGPYVAYKIEDKAAIVKRFDELGYIVVDYEGVMAAIYDFGNRLNRLRERVPWYEALEIMLRNRESGPTAI